MAGSTFLVIKGVDGESKDKKKPKSIEVMSWSHSFMQPTSMVRSTAGGGTVEQANHSDFSFTKYTDLATDDLLKACWSGMHYETATLFCYRSDGGDAVLYLQVDMEDVIIGNVSIGGGTGDIPTETVSLNYGKVTYTYIPADPETGKGGAKQAASHDLFTKTVA